MEIDCDELISKAVRDGVVNGVKEKLSNQYHSPLGNIINDAIKSKHVSLQAIFEEAISQCTADKEFVTEIQKQTRLKLAKLLVQRFGGELEKRVNELKSDPTTRARIVLAIDNIVKDKLETEPV